MILDVLFAICTLYGFYLGFSRGTFKTVFVILALVIALFVSIRFTPAMSIFLQTSLAMNYGFFPVIAFFLTMILSLLLLKLFFNLFEGPMKAEQATLLNRLIGGLLLGGIGSIVFGSLLWFVQEVQLLTETNVSGSIIYPYIKNLPQQFFDGAERIFPMFRSFWEYMLESIDQMNNPPQPVEYE